MNPPRRSRLELAADGAPATAVLDRPADQARALLVLTHGAGGGVDSPDLLALRDAALERGFAVARIVQHYRILGRRSPPAPATQDAQWLAAVRPLLRRRSLATLPVLVGGRSNGARVACRTAGDVNARAVVALAFPLHPPGRPERSRLEELEAPSVPVLVVQGDRDPFGMPPPGPGRTIHVLAGQGHAFTSRTVALQAAAAVIEFAERVTAPTRP